MVMRIRWVNQGGHIHCRVLTAPAKHQNFAKNGDLVFDEHEWSQVLLSLITIAEVIEDEF